MFQDEKLQLLHRSLDAYFDGLYSYAMSISRNREDAEDLVQETCVRAIRAVDRIHPESNLKSWLFTILHNIWLNELRRRKIAPPLTELDEDQGLAEVAVEIGKDPHALIAHEMEREIIRQAIRRLPIEHRKIIMLREYEELSYKDIADVLQCPIGTVMSRLQRARSKLRGLLIESTEKRGGVSS